MRRLLALAALAATTVFAQMPGSAKGYVTYDAEPISVPANKPAAIELHFKVTDGYHMNSHTPKSDLLIPTLLKIDATPGIKPGAIDYPAGHEYSFSFSPGEKLDVYSGPITIVAHLTPAAAGNYTVKGILSYQACDNAACYPPKKLPVEIDITAK